MILKCFMWKRRWQSLELLRAGTTGLRMQPLLWQRILIAALLPPGAQKLKRELRHLLYGKKPHIYRVIYEVDEQRKTVWLLHIRHGARRKLKASDLG